MDEAQSDGEGLELGGAELFRRVLQLYPLASPHDYFKNGRWQTDVMEVDLALLEAHRKEASAPEPSPLEDVKLPDDMPKENGENGQKRFWTPLLKADRIASMDSKGAMTTETAVPLAKAVQIKPNSSVYRPAKAKAPTLSVRPVLFTGYPKAAKAASLAAGPALPAGPKPVPKLSRAQPVPFKAVNMKSTSAELEQIDAFISKHSLVPVKTKISLAKLPAERRRWVLANYDGSATLDEFINNVPGTPSLASPLLARPKVATKPVSPSPPALRPLKRSLLQSLHAAPNGKSSPYKPLGLGASKVPKLGAATRLSSFGSPAAPKVGGPAPVPEEPGSLIRSILDCKATS